MRKWMIAFLLLGILTGCGRQPRDNIILTAKITSIYCGGMRIATDYGEFSQADVAYHEDLTMDFTPQVNQTVELTIFPHIVKADPVRIIAIKIVPSDGAATQKPGGYQKITPKEAKALIDAGDNLTILDVRSEEEYKKGHIKGSILIPDTEIEKQAGQMLPDKEKNILVYCQSGRRSKIASLKLIDLGYTHVIDMGGLSDWPYETEK